MPQLRERNNVNMTLFEYLSVAFSIVLSLATVRLLSGLSVALLRERRYWPHTAWIVLSLAIAALVWWNFWSFREVQWNLLSFLGVLSVPAMMYLLAAALVPEQPGRTRSWEDHFYAARRRFFSALAGFFIVAFSTTTFVIKLPLLHPVRGAQGFALTLALFGAFTSSRRAHHILPGLFAMMLLVAGTFFFLQPNSLVTNP